MDAELDAFRNMEARKEADKSMLNEELLSKLAVAGAKLHRQKTQSDEMIGGIMYKGNRLRPSTSSDTRDEREDDFVNRARTQVLAWLWLGYRK